MYIPYLEQSRSVSSAITQDGGVNKKTCRIKISKVVCSDFSPAISFCHKQTRFVDIIKIS